MVTIKEELYHSYRTQVPYKFRHTSFQTLKRNFTAHKNINNKTKILQKIVFIVTKRTGLGCSTEQIYSRVKILNCSPKVHCILELQIIFLFKIFLIQISEVMLP